MADMNSVKTFHYFTMIQQLKFILLHVHHSSLRGGTIYGRHKINYDLRTGMVSPFLNRNLFYVFHKLCHLSKRNDAHVTK